MHDCLTGKKSIPDRREKLHNWDIFTALILSTWIRRFTKEDDAAHTVGKKWAEIITRAFERGAPLEEWEEIAAGLTAGGRTEQAQHIRQLLGYDEPEEVAPLDSAASSRSPREDES